MHGVHGLQHKSETTNRPGPRSAHAKNKNKNNLGKKWHVNQAEPFDISWHKIHEREGLLLSAPIQSRLSCSIPQGNSIDHPSIHIGESSRISTRNTLEPPLRLDTPYLLRVFADRADHNGKKTASVDLVIF